MTWLMVVVGAATLAVWTVVFLDHFRLSVHASNAVSRGESWTLVHWIIGLAWAFGVLPSVLGLLQSGRQENQFDAVVATGLQARVATALSGVLVFLCCRLILQHLRKPTAASIAYLGAFLAPWFALAVLSGYNAGYLTGRQFFLYPVIAVAFWLSSPPLHVARTVGILAAVTAAASVLLALVSQLPLVNGGPAGSGKAIIGGPLLLAGPYSDANGFALTLALAAPAALLIQRTGPRIVALSSIGFALFWSAGRTSLIAATAGVAVYFVTQGRSWRALRGIGLTAAVVGVGLVVLTPLLEKSPTAFTSRGAVWTAGLADWQHHHLWLGGGPLYFERSELLSYVFSFNILAGHNLVVDTLVRGGIVGILALAALVTALVRRSVYLSRVSAFPLAFAITFIFASWLEVPLRVTNIGSLGYACWLPLAVIIFAKRDLGEAPGPSLVAMDCQGENAAREPANLGRASWA